MPEPSDICQTCNNSWTWHQENKPIHPFNNGEAGATAFLGKRGDRTHRRADNDAQRASETPPRVIWPTDPVLRVALINAGIITTEQLRAAEEQLSAAMGSALQEGGSKWSATGEVNTGSSTETGSPSTKP